MNDATILVYQSAHVRHEGVARLFGNARHSVLISTDERETIRRACDHRPDLVIVDDHPPEVDGVSLARAIRGILQSVHLPVLVVGQPAREEAALEAGADAFVFRSADRYFVLSRIGELLRGGQAGAAPPAQVASGRVCLDRLAGEVSVSGRSLRLTPTEFRLLWFMVAEHGRVFSREELQLVATGGGTQDQERVIDVHVGSLRRKLAEDASQLETVRGVGYRLAPLPD